jgi:hypothetical protein
MTTLINSDLVFSNADPFFGSSSVHNYNIQINDKGNIIIKNKSTYHSSSHPPTVTEKVINIEDNKPLPRHILNICKIIFNGINKNTQEVSTDIITWLHEIKKVQVDENDYEEMKDDYEELKTKMKEIEKEFNDTQNAHTNVLQENKKLQDKINRIQNDIIEKTLQNNRLNQKFEDLHDLYTKLLQMYNKKQL